MSESSLVYSSNLLTFKFEEKMNTIFSNQMIETAKSKLDEIIGKNKNSETLKIVFDMSEVEYISSSFFRLTLTCARRINEDNFSVINTNNFVRELFTNTGLSKYLNHIS